MSRARGGAPRIHAHTFRVRILEGLNAPLDAGSIWREIEIRGDQTLADLGDAIPGAFDFDDDHLWSFFLSGKAWDASTAYTCDDQEEGRPAERLRIRDAPAGREFLFLFDYGDEWHFGVKLAGTTEIEPGVASPRVVASNGEAPPQYADIGGWSDEDAEEDDDKEYQEERARLLERFEAWAEQRGASEDTWFAAAMLDYKWSAADAELTRWTADDLRDLLQEWCPWTIALPEERIPRVIPSARAFLLFLTDAELLDPDGDQHGALDATLDWIEPRFEAPMRDPSRFSAGGAALAEEAPAFPPVVLAQLDELRAAAAAAPALGRLRGLSEWVGEGRKLTAKGNLTARDRTDLAARLGSAVTAAVTAMLAGGTRDLAVVDLTLEWAGELRLVRIHKQRLVGVKRHEERLLDDPLELFNRAFDVLPALSEALLPTGMVEAAFADGLAGAIVDLLALMYLADEPVPVNELADHVWEDHVQLDVDAPGSVVELSRITSDIEVGQIVAQLEEMGMIEGVANDDDERGVALTPLGLWKTNVLLNAAGADAPVIGDLAGADVEALIDGVASYDEDACRAELRAWGQRRGGAAARELAAYARATPRFERQMLALVGLEEAGPAAEAEVRTMLEDEALRPQAQMWLVRNGFEDRDSVDPAAPALLMAESLATILAVDGPASLVRQVEGLGPPEEQIAMLDDVWRAPTPRVVDVLDAIGKAHPVPEVSKSARKAALKLRSAAGG